MPYIKKYKREDLDNLIKQFEAYMSLANRVECGAVHVGELNYLITKLCQSYVNYYGERYEIYNQVVGVIENVKLELYRRKIAKYEDKKIKENGDVY